MKIEILGTGCAKCNKLHQLVEKVVADTGADAEVTKVEKLEDIMKYGVAFTPALVIDGTVKAAGGIPKAAQIEAWLKKDKDEGSP
ncbi:MAG: TM0996/MTH895 family glutaredoxin-like protein [Deltaproteobacteria bacterium]|nr:TM0996/MTH895 family glutaredoxin-like protein [Deltaproteobacteria bacterium]